MPLQVSVFAFLLHLEAGGYTPGRLKTGLRPILHSSWTPVSFVHQEQSNWTAPTKDQHWNPLILSIFLALSRMFLAENCLLHGLWNPMRYVPEHEGIVWCSCQVTLPDTWRAIDWKRGKLYLSLKRVGWRTLENTYLSVSPLCLGRPRSSEKPC